MGRHLLLGVDASLSNTGLCGSIVGSGKFKMATVPLIAYHERHYNFPLTSSNLKTRYKSFNHGLRLFERFVSSFNADSATICFEYYSLGKKTTSLAQIVEYTSLLKYAVYNRFPGEIYEPAISQLKKFATNHGGSKGKKSDKDDIKLSAFITWKVNMLHRTSDEVDAFILMKIAQAIHDPESVKLNTAQKEVLKAVKDKYDLGPAKAQARKKAADKKKAIKKATRSRG
jgi:hypothetical protein